MNDMSWNPRTRVAGAPRTRRLLVLAALSAMLLVGGASACQRDRPDAPRFDLVATDHSASTPPVGIAAAAGASAVDATATRHRLDPRGAGRKEIHEFAECFVLGMGLGRVLTSLLGGLYGALLAAAAAVRCI